MINVTFELDRLRLTLRDRGVDERTIANVLVKARKEIESTFAHFSEQALEQAVALGVEKRAPRFINELRLDALNFEIETSSGSLDFSEPPRPMLPFLLKNAKPMNDGTGSYKVIPVGKPGDRAKVATSIIDVQKRIMAERVEQARARQKQIAPEGSKQQFRVASTKQDPNTQWVMPAQEKNFSDDMKEINEDLAEKMGQAIRDIIQGYEEMY